MSKIRRDWTAAREKVDEERACRGCGIGLREIMRLHRSLEAAHIMGREHDRKPLLSSHDRLLMATEMAYAIGSGSTPIDDDYTELIHGTRGGKIIVAPVRIVPLCGPATDSATCHYGLDSHRRDFSLLGKLTPEEEAQAVLDAGGLELVRVRVAPSEYPSKIASR